VKTRSRFVLAGSSVALVLLGLACRRPFAPELARLYLGDVLWGGFFFVGFAWLRPRAAGFRLGLAAATATVLIELSQLYRAPWIDRLRDTGLGGLLLGHGFSWSDVLCVLLGAALATALDFLATVAS
jgi:hypothetical protein